jgi:photosystem II stability/assembly factor-like uncharacterized protein
MGVAKLLVVLFLIHNLASLHAQKHFASGDNEIIGNRLISVRSEPGKQLYRVDHVFQPRTVVIDGKMAEKDWQVAPVITPLLLQNGDLDRTSVHVLFDRAHIYLFWEVEEDDGVTASLIAEDGVITGDDYVQVDLTPLLPDSIKHARDYYYTIAVNPLGTVWDSYFDPYLNGFFFSSWDSNVTVAVQQKEKGWDLEMSIPFSGLDLLSDPGWNWQLRFHHGSASADKQAKLSSAELGVTVQQDVMVRRPSLVSYYWPRPNFMQEVKPDMSTRPDLQSLVEQLPSKPPLDSKENSEIWRSVETLPIDRTDKMGERLQDKTAAARVGLAGSYLCVNLRAEGAKVDRTATAQTELGQGMAGQMAGVNGVFVDQALFQNECFWIILQPRSSKADPIHQDYYQIIIDNRGRVSGTRYDPYGAPFRSWSPKVELDLYDTSSGWGAEALIDLASFDLPADIDQTWGLNLFRNRLLDEGKYELQAWSFTANNFLHPKTFGALEGVTGVTPESVKSGLLRKRQELLSRLEGLPASGSRQISGARNQLQSLPLFSQADLVEAEKVLETVDNLLGTIEASVYYDSVPHPVHGGYPLMDIQFIGNQGWAVGAMGTILKTEDGGRAWRPIKIDSDADLYRVDFVNEREGWAAGGRIRIAETNESMRHDRRGGYGYIFRTTDGGETWECQFGERGRLLLGLDFVDSRIGYAVGERGYLLKTTDGGSHWFVLPTTGTVDWLYGVHFKDARTGFAVGLNETVIKTSDGGNSWVAIEAPADRQPYGFSPIYTDITFNGETGCIVGQNGTVLISNDGGDSWHPSATFFRTEIRDLMDLRSVHFVTPQQGYAVGELGSQMLTTDDGGKSWSYRPLPNTGWLRAVWADTRGRIVLAGEQERVLVSRDAGKSWRQTQGQTPKADVLVMMAHGDDAAINLNSFYAHYAINEGKTIVDLGVMSDVHSSEYEETYNLEHDRNMWMVGVRTATNFNEFETGNNGSDYYHFTERLWEGEENVVRHMVAAIRAYRPEIVISHGGVFGDYDKPGHKLSGRAGLSAFDRAGGEVDHYPELTRLGLAPWQPKKLYNLASESYPVTLDLTSIGKKPLKGTGMTCMEFGEYVIRNFQSQGVYHTRNGKLSLVRSLVPVPTEEACVFNGLEKQ